MIVKSSELTRTRRKGRREKTWEWRGRSSAGFCFLAMKSRSQGPRGRKVQNQARKMDKENQGRVVGDGQGRADGALGTGRLCVASRALARSPALAL